MVHASIRMVIPFKKQGEALEIFTSMAERARFEPGCISCRVYRGSEEEHVLMFEERWRSEEDFERRLRSNDYRKVPLFTAMALEPPEIRFDLISHSTGFETIEKARSSPDRMKKF